MARVALIVLGCVFLLLVLALVAARVSNDGHLARFSAQLFDYPLPPGANEVGRSAEVGVLTGNGNHCDFRARRELVTELPIETVRGHFAGLRLSPAIAGGAGGGLPMLEVRPRERGGYVVTVVDAPYEGSLDLRCH